MRRQPPGRFLLFWTMLIRCHVRAHTCFRLYQICVICVRTTGNNHRKGFMVRWFRRRWQWWQLDSLISLIEMERLKLKMPTPRISLITKMPPPPFLPFNATMAPGKSPIAPAPCVVFRNFKVGLKRRGIREPEPSIREDSIKIELSDSL